MRERRHRLATTDRRSRLVGQARAHPRLLLDAAPEDGRLDVRVELVGVDQVTLVGSENDIQCGYVVMDRALEASGERDTQHLNLPRLVPHQSPTAFGRIGTTFCSIPSYPHASSRSRVADPEGKFSGLSDQAIRSSIASSDDRSR